MSALTVQFPDYLHRSVQLLADREGCSLDHFLALAAAEKVSALLTVDYLKTEAALADRGAFERFLAAVPDGPVLDTDRLPD